MKIFSGISGVGRVMATGFFLLLLYETSAQTAMINFHSRKRLSLNGEWSCIIDPTGIGEWRKVWEEKKPQRKTDFVEYGFEGGPVLKVPGDFNSQMRELSLYEGIVWYKKAFNYTLREGKRLFLYFGAANYATDVFLNGEKIGRHEGGFTPFQFELTGKLKAGPNALVVKVNNHRKENGLPGLGYDWFNYGGITRDLALVETSNTYIEDYHIQLRKGDARNISGYVQLNGSQRVQQVEVQIPELGIRYKTRTDEQGRAKVECAAAVQRWTPNFPKLYSVVLKGETDVVRDSIGFRNIETRGNQVWLNGNPIFLKAVNIHEENPYKAARAYTEADARLLLSAAKELGCNMVRLAHYPHNEHMVKQAERMGLMVWSELPVYQHIQFADSSVKAGMALMLKEMIRRDRNRCGIVVWSLSNETYPSTPGRNDALIELTRQCRNLDSTRLVAHAVNSQWYTNHIFGLNDTLCHYSDLLSINEYIGWYLPWQGKPSATKWSDAFREKPVFISEFGGEALYGNNDGPEDEAAFWTEAYQEKIYKDQLEMFGTVPNLCGICPWLLFDYRSSGRMHPVYQKGYNRKGLLSEKGEKKKAWYIMKTYYDSR